MNLKTAIKTIIEKHYPDITYIELKETFTAIIEEKTGNRIVIAKDQKKTKGEREKQFREKSSKFILVYGDEMISEFCDYWTESNDQGKKLRFEFQKTWSLQRRLKTWSQRSKAYKQYQNANSQNEHLITEQTAKAVFAKRVEDRKRRNGHI